MARCAYTNVFRHWIMRCALVAASIMITANFAPAAYATPMHGVACPSSTQCTAVGEEGKEVTFDPQAPGTPTVLSLDGAERLMAVACPVPTQCTAVDSRGHELTLDPTSPASSTKVQLQITNSDSVSCPTATQCTAVEEKGGYEVTFEVAAPGAAAPALIGHPYKAGKVVYMYGIACPSETLCTAVDGEGQEMTFNPKGPGTPAPAMIDPGFPLYGVACMSASQCIAGDKAGNEVTFDPVAPVSPTLGDVSNGATSMIAISCPTADQCTGAVGGGYVTTFNPSAPSSANVTQIDSNTLNSVACPSTTQCTVVDSAGQELTFNPVAPGKPTPNMVMPSPPPPPPRPTEISPPTISGTTTQGMTLAETHAAWRNNPTSYTYRWERCDVNGANCQTAGVGTVETYVLTAKDVGSRMRVIETADNAGGSGQAESEATEIVQAAPPPIASVGAATTMGEIVEVPVTCAGAPDQSCTVSLSLTVAETLAGKRIVALAAARRGRHKTKDHKETVAVGARSIVLQGGTTTTLLLNLNSTGERLLKVHRKLSAQLRITMTTGSGAQSVITTQTIMFTAITHAKKHKKHRRRGRHR